MAVNRLMKYHNLLLLPKRVGRAGLKLPDCDITSCAVVYAKIWPRPRNESNVEVSNVMGVVSEEKCRKLLP